MEVKGVGPQTSLYTNSKGVEAWECKAGKVVWCNLPNW